MRLLICRKWGNNAYRFINAVSDFATHSRPLRMTANYKENVFARTIDGNPLIDKSVPARESCINCCVYP